MTWDLKDPAQHDGLKAAKARATSIRAICACPKCRGSLTWTHASACCDACGAMYSIFDGVPVLRMNEEMRTKPERWNPVLYRRLPRRLRTVAERYRSVLVPSLTYRSPATNGLIGRFVSSLPAAAVIVNVGSGKTQYGTNVVNVDIDCLAGVDVIGVAENLPLGDACCDGVILQAVLEHVRDADRTLEEIHRVLRPGGSIFIEVPFIQGYHASPSDYRRYTDEGLRAEVSRHGFEVLESGVAVGPASAMAWVTAEFLALLASGRNVTAYRFLRLLTRWLAAPIKYADRWMDRHPAARSIPSGVWVKARRI